MGFFSKLFKGPEIDMEKSNANAEKMRLLFNQAVENGADYQLIFAYTEDVSRFNYGFVHGSKTKVGNLIVGWNEANQTIVALPTVPALSGCGAPTYYRRSEILKAYRNKYPTDAFIIYPDRKSYIGINACDWLEDESLYADIRPAAAVVIRRLKTGDNLSGVERVMEFPEAVQGMAQACFADAQFLKVCVSDVIGMRVNPVFGEKGGIFQPACVKFHHRGFLSS